MICISYVGWVSVSFLRLLGGRVVSFLFFEFRSERGFIVVLFSLLFCNAAFCYFALDH